MDKINYGINDKINHEEVKNKLSKLRALEDLPEIQKLPDTLREVIMAFLGLHIRLFHNLSKLEKELELLRQLFQDELNGKGYDIHEFARTLSYCYHKTKETERVVERVINDFLPDIEQLLAGERNEAT